MKDKAFARQVPRDHLRRGAELMSLPLDEHVANVITFMREKPTRWACGERCREAVVSSCQFKEESVFAAFPPATFPTRFRIL